MEHQRLVPEPNARPSLPPAVDIMPPVFKKSSLLLRRHLDAVGGALVLAALYAVSLYRYVLFHSLAELFSVVVACGVFMVYWNARRFLDNGYFLFVGSAYLCVGFIDLLHTLAYKGMGVFPDNDGNVANQLWIAARYVESLSFVAACVFLRRRLNVPLLAAGYAAVVALLLGSIFAWRVFPDCFIDGVGVTGFKTVNEYVICGILGLSIALLVRQRAEFDRKVFRLLLGSLAVTIASELSFSYYTNPYGFNNLVGHLFKLVSFYLLYRAFIEEGLRRPYDLIFRNLKRSELALRKSKDEFAKEREFLNAVLDNIRDGIVVCNAEGVLTLFNPASRQFHGLPEKPIPAAQWPEHFDLYLPDGTTRMTTDDVPLYRALRGDAVHNVEMVIAPRGMDSRRLLTDGRQLVLGGKLVGAVAVMHDITEQRQTEEALRLAQFCIDCASDSVFWLDIHGRVIYANDEACRALGYSSEELRSLTVHDIDPTFPRNVWAAHWEELRRKKSLVVRSCHRTKSGTLIPVEIALNHIDFGGKEYNCAFARDITQRQQAEAAVRESEERYRSLVENIDMGITLIDRQHRILMVNNAQATLFGRTPRDYVGQACFQAFEKRDTICDHCPGVQAMTTGRSAEVETQGVRDDGSRFTARLRAFPVVGTDGTPTGFIEVVEDITNRKRADEELSRAKEAAEAANLAKSEFLANMSHEIRTPMTAILGFADILRGRSTDQECDEAARIIQRNGQHLLHLINDILDLSKIEAGKFEVEHVVCLPHQIVAEVVSTMKVRADAKGLPLTLDVLGDVPERITTDPARLRQILVNLIGNAIKFTEVGGVRVVMRFDGTSADDAKLRFDVIDTGIGMSEKQLALLFQPFAQADASTRRRFGGTGLGLAISKRLAGMLGGEVSVSSTPEQGSTFSLTITAGLVPGAKLAGGAVTAKPQPPVTSIPQPLKCRVLLAEDGPDNQRLIAFLLRKSGAEVVVAENGQIAVRLALAAEQAGSPFDVILMDMQMPVMDGYEATGQLRNAGYANPIIALTAHAMTEDRQKCIEAGCNEYASKPIHPGSLLELIGTWVGKDAKAYKNRGNADEKQGAKAKTEADFDQNPETGGQAAAADG